jgi:P pilus assembly chaperone PapD
MLRRVVTALFLYSLVATPANAVEVTPMVITFSPYDSVRTPFSLVYNQLPRDIAFDIQVYEVDFDPTGATEPKLIPVDDAPLWVFPPSLYLKAGKSQRIQFRWVGKNVPSVDKTYQVSLIEQPIANLPIEKQSKLTILLDVNLIVHIDQAVLTPDISVGPSNIKNGVLIAKVMNKGAGASRLSDYDIDIVEDGVELKHIAKQELKSQGYDVFFPPKSAMFVKIPVSDLIKKNKNNVKLELME